jgi:hypothetical protein
LANPEKAPKLDTNLAGASGDWDALEKRGLAFLEQVPEMAKQLLLPMTTIGDDDESKED